MLLRMNGSGGEGSDYGSSDAGSYEYDEEGDDYEEELEHHLRVHHHEHPSGDGDGEGEGEGAEGSDYDEEYEEDEEGEPEVDPAEFENDEAYARALQDAEELEVAARLMALAGLSDCEHILFIAPILVQFTI
jgi:E3 ubiquitin-protein ligase BIG BROTHER and related proteins